MNTTCRKLEVFQKSLDSYKEQQHYKHLRLTALPPNEESRGLCFTSQDVLCLFQHPYVKEKSLEATAKWGMGLPASKARNQQLEYQKKIEKTLASLLGCESVILHQNTFQVLCHLLKTLSQHPTFVFVDRFCHRKLLQISSSLSPVRKYEHHDLEELENLLRTTPAKAQKIIITESLFATDGTISDLERLSQLAKKYSSLLYLDDTQTVGLSGWRGMGSAAQRLGIDLIAGAFYQQDGSVGGFLGCPKVIRNYLTTFCYNFPAINHLPPAALGAIGALIDLMPDMQWERKIVCERSRILRDSLLKKGWDIANSQSHQIPLCLSSGIELQDLATFLKSEGILASPLSAPILPDGYFRLRVTVNSSQTREHHHQLLQTLEKWRGT